MRKAVIVSFLATCVVAGLAYAIWANPVASICIILFLGIWRFFYTTIVQAKIFPSKQAPIAPVSSGISKSAPIKPDASIKPDAPISYEAAAQDFLKVINRGG